MKDLDGTIINSKQIIKGTTKLDDTDGTILSGNGSFNLQKNAKLTIDSKLTILHNKQLFFGEGEVDFLTGSVEQLNVVWFGATPNDASSDASAIQRTIDAAIHSKGVSVVYFPPGEYIIDKPLLALRDKNKNGVYDFLNLTLKGHQLAYNNPGDGKSGVSVLKANKEIPFIFGVQAARGLHIKNMVFDGFITKKFSPEDLIYKSSNQLYKQNRYAPLSAIVIDPFSSKKPKNGGYEGFDGYYTEIRASTHILIEGSAIENFPTGISITPNGETQQGDSVIINFTRFTNLVNGIVICQTQSRNIVVDKCSFGRMKYCFNSEDFGEQNGILPEVNNIKVADGVAWLYKANGNVAYGHFRNVYTEELYGIGYSVLNKQPLNFEGCVFKLRPMKDNTKQSLNPCILRADNASFIGCTFLVGGGKSNNEPIVMDVKKATFINSYLDTYPINIGKSIVNTNITDYYNSSLRKIKLNKAPWNDRKYEKIKTLKVLYDKKLNEYRFKNESSYKKGDFIFGQIALNLEPFRNEKIVTIIGQVNKVKNKTIFFESNLLEKQDKLVKIIEK
ncbi:glycosyl hydrolase family 28-related protein [Marixanthomonas ophiurae]|uniref:glycosyl hydrolase family 28-related protein n=1 Tax=Marixanthomonas ophiurae TaxID=387659 RepID=UPI0013143E77|nr:glycosyl hydrolase family 28-related protein [Marixanthomonas ophiurae]